MALGQQQIARQPGGAFGPQILVHRLDPGDADERFGQARAPGGRERGVERLAVLPVESHVMVGILWRRSEKVALEREQEAIQQRHLLRSHACLSPGADLAAAKPADKARGVRVVNPFRHAPEDVLGRALR